MSAGGGPVRGPATITVTMDGEPIEAMSADIKINPFNAATHAINRGQQYPYAKIDNQDWAVRAALAIAYDLSNRSGIKHEMMSIDEDIRSELVEQHAAIIRAAAALEAAPESSAIAMQAVDAATALDLFEAEQQRILSLDPRERAMQHNYSRTMTVCYEFREFIRKLQSQPSPVQAIDAGRQG